MKESKYRIARGHGAYDRLLDKTLADIDDRLNRIEERVNRTARKEESTRSQQMLILHYMGFLKNDMLLNLSNKKKSKLLSVLLNSSSDNIEGDLSTLNSKKSALRTSKNYEFILKVFAESGLKELAKDIESELLDIRNREEKSLLK